MCPPCPKPMALVMMRLNVRVCECVRVCVRARHLDLALVARRMNNDFPNCDTR